MSSGSSSAAAAPINWLERLWAVNRCPRWVGKSVNLPVAVPALLLPLIATCVGNQFTAGAAALPPTPALARLFARGDYVRPKSQEQTRTRLPLNLLSVCQAWRRSAMRAPLERGIIPCRMCVNTAKFST